MRWIAVVFILLEAFAAFWLGAVSRHGPPGLGLSALLYVLLAPIFTWFIASRYQGRPRLQRVVITTISGIMLLGLAPVLLLALDWVDEVRREQAISSTHIRHVVDEPILSENGHEIGVRVSFSIELSSSLDAVGVMPMLYSRNPADRNLFLIPLRRFIDGTIYTSGELEAGRYFCTVDLYPAIVSVDAGGEPCALGKAPPLDVSTPANPLLISIDNTSFGVSYRGGQDEFTRHSYSIARMYQSIIDGALPPCRKSD